MLADLFRLIVLILFLPLIIIFIGPFLILSVVRGQQRMGPVTLDSTRYDFAGRAGIFMLGLAIWILVWGGLVWLGLNALSSAPVVLQMPPVGPSPELPTAAPTFTATPSPSAIPATDTPTATPVPPTPTLTPTSTPTLGPIIPAARPTHTATATLSPTTLFNETLVTATPTPNAVLTVTPSLPTITATLGLSDRQAAVDTLEEANALLQKAIALANEENLENLETVWQDIAFTKIADFASELYERYAKPLNVDFEYITPPRIREQLATGEIVVVSRERWRYGGPTTVNEEAFEFIYTLSQKDGRWVITRYSYRNLSLPTSTTIPLERVVTPTVQN